MCGISLIPETAEGQDRVYLPFYLHHVLPRGNYSRLHADEQSGHAGYHLVPDIAGVLQRV
ncbi:hypothetical protein D3C81_2224210 [compost metagenome]